MTATGGSDKLGGRPTAEAQSGCGECGHPKALHSNGRTPCKAFSCTAGPDGQPCQGFVAAGVTVAA